MARHSTARTSSQRHRLIAVALVVACAAIASSVIALVHGSTHPLANWSTKRPVVSSPGCGAHGTLRVAAASGIAPVLQTVAERSCLQLSVTRSDDEGGAMLLAKGAVDVWVPDSSERAFLTGPAARSAPSIATSPIVMAARASGIAKASWAMLLQPAGGAAPRVVIEDPRKSSVNLGVAGVLAGIATTVTHDRYLGVAGAAQAINAMSSTSASTLTAADQGRLYVVEQRLIDHGPATSGSTTPQTAVLLPAEGVPYLDYPWVAGPRTATTRANAARLLAALLGPSGVQARRANGLLEPRLPSFTPPGGSTAIPLIAHVPADQVPTLYAVADSAAYSSNAIAVLDVSGSMGDAQAGGKAPIDIVRPSALAVGQGVRQPRRPRALGVRHATRPAPATIASSCRSARSARTRLRSAARWSACARTAPAPRCTTRCSPRIEPCCSARGPAPSTWWPSSPTAATRTRPDLPCRTCSKP